MIAGINSFCGNFILSDTISWVEENMKWSNRSGPEWFLMTHIADLAFWMMSDKPVEIFAMAREGLLKSKGFETRDLVKAQMKMESGAVIHFESSWILARNWRNPLIDMWATVQGEEGRIDMNSDFENIAITTNHFQTPFVLNNITEIIFVGQEQESFKIALEYFLTKRVFFKNSLASFPKAFCKFLFR